jgi:hypothetical protein
VADKKAGRSPQLTRRSSAITPGFLSIKMGGSPAESLTCFPTVSDMMNNEHIRHGFFIGLMTGFEIISKGESSG